MSKFVKNAPIRCNRCGHGPFQGRESSSKRSDGSIHTECRWICPRCVSLVRLDEKVIPAKQKDD
jgi:hypothetical protein